MTEFEFVIVDATECIQKTKEMEKDDWRLCKPYWTQVCNSPTLCLVQALFVRET